MAWRSTPTNATDWLACTLDVTGFVGPDGCFVDLIESLMKDNTNGNSGSARRREEPDSSQAHRDTIRAAARINGRPQEERLSFLSVMDLVIQRWHWLVLGAACGATFFYLLGFQMIKPKFTAMAQLIRYEAPGRSETLKTTPVSGDTFAAIIRAPELIQEVCQRALPPI